MSSKLRYTVKCLLENKLRFVLTVLSISVGVVSILIVNSISTLGVSAVGAELDSLGMNGLIVHRESSSASLCDDEIEKIASVDGVEKIAPVTVNTSEVYDNFSSNSTSSVVWGVDESTPDVISFEMLYGRFINKGDIKANSKVCIIDRSLANELFSRDNVVGKSVKLMCGSSVEDFEVVGVVQTGKGIMQSLMGTYFPAFLYVPYTAFSSGGDYDKLFLKINTSVDSEKVTEEVEKTLLSTGNNDDYLVSDMAGQKGVLDNLLNIVTLVLTVIGAIALLVSGISIMNIMLISVNERTREIGIKKSIGATASDIMQDFLAESVIISLIGAVAGVVCSVVIVKAASLIVGMSASVSVAAALGTMAVTMAVGVIFGIFPAYKASCFNPVEALRR